MQLAMIMEHFCSTNHQEETSLTLVIWHAVERGIVRRERR
jgi:hypothetical protein